MDVYGEISIVRWVMMGDSYDFFDVDLFSVPPDQTWLEEDLTNSSKVTHPRRRGL